MRIELTVHEYGGGQIGKAVRVTSCSRRWLEQFVEGFESVLNADRVYVIVEELDGELERVDES